jgi:hypothetical protein
MKLSAALDTSTSKTAVCVVNSRDGSVVFEVSVATDPAIIFGALAPLGVDKLCTAKTGSASTENNLLRVPATDNDPNNFLRGSRSLSARSIGQNATTTRAGPLPLSIADEPLLCAATAGRSLKVSFDHPSRTSGG